MPRSRLSLSVLVALVLVAGTACRAAAQESRQVLYTLEAGETFLQPESAIVLAMNGDDIVLVTAKGKNGPFFVVRNGTRKGPFARLDEVMEAAHAGRDDAGGIGRDCAVYLPDVPAIEPEMGDGDGGQTLRFKGATIGPHAVITSRKVTPDGALVYVTAADADKFWLEASDGRRVSFGGTPGDIQISPDGKNAAVEVQGTLGMSQMEGLSKLPPEKLAAAMQDMEKKTIYTIDGKKFGPFGDELDGFWYARTSNDLYYRVKGQLFRNDAPVAGAGSFDRCDFYPSPDGTSYAVAGYDAIKFSDGKQYPAPLALAVHQAKGQAIFKWVSFENGKDIVVYQRPM